MSKQNLQINVVTRQVFCPYCDTIVHSLKLPAEVTSVVKILKSLKCTNSLCKTNKRKKVAE